jgi:ribosomal protein L11 methyltransferase
MRVQGPGSRVQANPLAVVSAEVPPASVDALLEAPALCGLACAAWEDRERHTCRVQVFLARGPGTSGPSGAAAAALRAAGRQLGLRLRPETRVLPAQDWSESWKRFFRVERISARLVVRPSWEKYAPRRGEVVLVLDPGMSFGTGRHATTRACLVFLDRLARENPRRSALDMGCGSGILAIAAARLGFAPVAGFDNDPEAVAIARRNARRNRAAIAWQVCGLERNRRRADVVVANILAPVLIEHAARVAAAVQPGPAGALILSGILDTQYAAVRRAYETQGYEEVESLLRGEWRSGLFQASPRTPAPAPPAPGGEIGRVGVAAAGEAHGAGAAGDARERRGARRRWRRRHNKGAAGAFL